MSQDTFLHVGFLRDGTEKSVLSLNPDRDTSASWHMITKEIMPGRTLTIWFYGVKRIEKCEGIFWQTERAILDGSFADWFEK